jgi:hypothetical protein
MNKFEALKTFQAWPPEWQRLCAECWIETGEVEPKQAWTTADKIQTAGELVAMGVSIPSDQPKAVLTHPRGAAKMSAANTRRRRQSISLPWSITESEYLLKLASEQWEQCHVVQMFLEKYPGRSPDAVRRRVWGVRSGKESGEVKY